jgi:hypothetical protein
MGVASVIDPPAGIDARDELVVGPDREAQHAGAEDGVEDRPVGEELLAREDRDDVGRQPDRGQQHHVDLGMAEEPEKVLPEDRVTAAVRIEEGGAEGLVHEEHDRTGDQRPHRRHEEHARHHDHPDHHRDVVELHSRRAGVHGRRDEVDPAQQEGHEFQGDGEHP